MSSICKCDFVLHTCRKCQDFPQCISSVAWNALWEDLAFFSPAYYFYTTQLVGWMYLINFILPCIGIIIIRGQSSLWGMRKVQCWCYLIWANEVDCQNILWQGVVRITDGVNLSELSCQIWVWKLYYTKPGV